MKHGTKILTISFWALGGIMIWAGMSRSPGGLEGEYSQPNEIIVINPQKTGAVEDFDRETVNSVLTIRNDRGRSIDVDVALVGNNLHMCDVDGTAVLRPRNPLSNRLVFRFTQPPEESLNGVSCVFDVVVSRDSIALKVDEKTSDACQYYCGARMRLSDGDFKRSTRRDLKD